MVASNIGRNTVLNAPTWSCTNLMQVNCNDHIRLQANKAPHDNKDFFIIVLTVLFAVDIPQVKIYTAQKSNLQLNQCNLKSAG